VIDVYANLGSVGTGGGNSGANVGIALTGFKYKGSDNIERTSIASSNGLNLAGFPQYVYKTKPTISLVALPTTILTNGTQTIAKFSVTADAGGTLAWRRVKFSVATSSDVVFSGQILIYDDANQSTPLPGTSCVLERKIVTCISTQDQEVVGSKTYVLKAPIGGTLASGSFISTSIPSSGIGYAVPTQLASVSNLSSFTWSDESITPHSESTPDWSNDFLVKNLPTDTQTLSKP
jgi:hypothetical protein